MFIGLNSAVHDKTLSPWHEFVYVLKGNCKLTSRESFYVYKKGQVHEVINDFQIISLFLFV